MLRHHFWPWLPGDSSCFPPEELREGVAQEKLHGKKQTLKSAKYEGVGVKTEIYPHPHPDPIH